ncbi:MAG: two-component sensor histidine kinase [Oscillatoriophycideae cyanobacterium NC_groundwater_1537_Pr4_S-0.65um_50_18]|nr:two-component sensor histidine kinase [Oscillatoriophycideae cyanobacterium NC_groundwater_1537_Pr4_S-0.65um_50_18]
MTLLKRFTAWGIGSSIPKKRLSHSLTKSRSPVSSLQFRALYWRLLLSYLGAMAAVVGISTTVVYQVVAQSLYDRFDRQLIVLSDAAAHSLAEIAADRNAVDRRITVFDNDGDFDLPWQDVRATNQTIEWVDAQHQPLVIVGSALPNAVGGTGFQTWPAQHLRAFTIAVYTAKQPKTQENLRGYVRVSESTKAIEDELSRLLSGLGIGGLSAIILIGLTGSWLTQRSLQPIEQSVWQLKQFTADASHELRSPLTAIQTTTEVIQSHPERINPADFKKVEAIASATRQMASLVEDLLLLARSDALPNAETHRLIPIDDILEDLLTRVQPQAIAKDITLVAEDIIPVWINGNGDSLYRLFANLLENALQYTPKGGKISLMLYKTRSEVWITVADTGIGIEPAHLPLVFDRFWRADRARSHRAGGTGLGLAIAQAIAQAHGGEITVTSQVGIGSCFQVRLPIVAKNLA